MKMKIVLALLPTLVLTTQINSSYQNARKDPAYNELTYLTPYRFEHYSSAAYFVLAYDAGLGFDSSSAEQHGPFTLLKTQDYIEFYNLRYGAISRGK